MNQLDHMLADMERDDLAVVLENTDPERVRGALYRKRKTARDLALLLSPGADAVLEEIAQCASRITFERFGKTVGLYVPVYLSNYCVGRCPYCGFRAGEDIVRRTLRPDEIAEEMKVVQAYGMRDVLLVAGESLKEVNIDYLGQAVSLAREYVPSVSVEVAPLSKQNYKALTEHGAYGVTLYQETFDRAKYTEFHPTGPKSDYRYRLESLDRAGAAGVRKLTAGALFGLAPWRMEGLRLGIYVAYLQKKWWKSQVSVGLPRLHNAPSDFSIPYAVDDRALVHLIVALRVFSEDLGIAISTRETPAFRTNLLGLGVTYMSAGSKTEPGGYSESGVSGNQFEVADLRAPSDVAKSLIHMGYDPVWKDWDYSFGWRSN
jgi:2-iminoacetate synthase